MITTIVLVNTSIMSHNFISLVVRTFRIQSLSDSKAHNTVLVTIITMLGIGFPELICLLVSSLFLPICMFNKFLSTFLEGAGYSAMNVSVLRQPFHLPCFHQKPRYMFHKLGMLCNALLFGCQLQKRENRLLLLKMHQQIILQEVTLKWKLP